MSKIAEALVKAKERTGTTIAPFFTTGSAGTPALPPVDEAKAKALRKARNTQRFWVALLSVAAILTFLVIWNRLHSDAPPGPSVANPPPPAAAKPESAPATQVPTAATPKVETPGRDPSAAASSAVPRIETYNAVNALVITAVLPGERPRLMYKGRIVAVGEPVEGELDFAGVQDDRLVFTDRRGAVYTRRY